MKCCWLFVISIARTLALSGIYDRKTNSTSLLIETTSINPRVQFPPIITSLLPAPIEYPDLGNATLISEIFNKTQYKIFFILDYSSLPPTAEEVSVYLSAIMANEKIGAIGWRESILEVDPTGFFYTRKQLSDSFNTSYPTFWMRTKDSQQWFDMMNSTNQMLQVLIEQDPNQWFIMFSQPWVTLVIDIYGCCAIFVSALGIFGIFGFILIQNGEAKANRTSSARRSTNQLSKISGYNFRYNLMFNILLMEILSNILRSLMSWGQGMLMLDRGISFFCFYFSTETPHFLVFVNALCLMRSWIKMTKMQNINIAEMNKKLVAGHLFLASFIVLLNVAYSVALTTITPALSARIADLTILILFVIVILTIFQFSLGFHEFRKSITTTVAVPIGISSSNKALNENNMAIRKFKFRSNLLALAIGFSLTAGAILIGVYSLTNLSNVPLFYTILLLAEEFVFLFASLSQTAFAVLVLTKRKAKTTSLISTKENSKESGTSTLKGKTKSGVGSKVKRDDVNLNSKVESIVAAESSSYG